MRARGAALPLLLRGAAAVAASGCAAAVTLLFRFDPARFGFYPRCPLYVLTGYYCAGCGALRAAHQLLHGHLLRALDYNAFFVLLVPVLAYAGLSWVAERTRGRPLPAPRLSGGAVWAILAVIMAFTVLRNLPYPPFAVLAP